MAHCSVCGKNVGCSCSLTNGKCHNCIGEPVPQGEVKKKQTKRIVYDNSAIKNPPAQNDEFSKILKNKGLSKQEKIKRINDILEKAKSLIP